MLSHSIARARCSSDTAHKHVKRGVLRVFEDSDLELLMEYTGRVANGVIVLDNGDAPPEGTRVKVVPVTPEADQAPASGGESLDEFLQRYAGRAKGLPSDMAAQHDHYLHGQPKR